MQNRIPQICTLLVAATFAGGIHANAQPKNQTKGQAQTAGGIGQFGTIYSLKGGFNFTILSAKYTLAPFIAYAPLKADDTKKLLVLDIAIKNASPNNNFFNDEGLFTAIDQTGAEYHSQQTLESTGAKGWPSTLKPGQGLGQPALHNPLQAGFVIPDKARIVKIIVNRPLLLQKVDIIRYYVAGATKEEAGAAGNPKNVISPLPDYAKDPADASGAVALDEAKGTIGLYLPSGDFELRLDSFAFSTTPAKGDPPPAGKKYAVATITAKYLGYENGITMFHIYGGDFPEYQTTDSEGEREKPSALLHAKRDENPDHKFQHGDEYTFRLVFTLPADDTVKKLILGTIASHKLAYDVSGVK